MGREKENTDVAVIGEYCEENGKNRSHLRYIHRYVAQAQRKGTHRFETPEQFHRRSPEQGV